MTVEEALARADLLPEEHPDVGIRPTTDAARLLAKEVRRLRDENETLKRQVATLEYRLNGPFGAPKT